MRGNKSQEIDEYINSFPPKVRKLLKQVRETVRRSAPQADEKIAYRIPTFVLNGNLVHFAAFASHISFFPTSSGIRAFKKELTKYKTSAGTVQFPFDQPIPYTLIGKMVKFRVNESLKVNRSSKSHSKTKTKNRHKSHP